MCRVHDVDVGHSWLYLNFDEPVVAAALVLINKITVLSSVTGVGTTFTFRPVALQLRNLTQVQVTVANDDMNSIKIAVSGPQCALQSICSTTLLNELIMGAGTIYDLNNNYNLVYDLTNAVPVRHFIPDTVPPSLSHIVMDLSKSCHVIQLSNC